MVPPSFRQAARFLPLLLLPLALLPLCRVVSVAPAPLGANPSRAAELAADLQDLFADLAERVRPAVVSIGSSEVVRLPDDRQDIFGRLFRGHHREWHRRSLGSGLIVDRRGHILTNSHVVTPATGLLVTLWNNQELPARVIQKDDALDIALIKVEHPNLEPVPLGNSEDLRVGHWVIAVGNPFGLSQTVSVGIVSAVGRHDVGILPVESFIQTDAAIHEGNSGGPLVNLEGDVVGINTAIRSDRGKVNVGIGFAIPIDQAKVLVDKWIDGKTAGFLGVTAERIDEDMAAYFDLESRKGAFVREVEPGSPAARANLQPTDIITRFDGQEVRSVEHLRLLIARCEGPEAIPITVLRDGRTVDLPVTITPRRTDPAPETSRRSAAAGVRPGGKEALGITVSPVDGELAAQLGLAPETRGIAVVDVELNSPADRKGIRVGDIIEEVNGVEVPSIKNFRKALERSRKSVMLKILRKGKNAGYYFLRRS